MRANVCTQQVRDCRLWLLLLLPAMVVAFTPLTPARMHLARSGGPEAVYRQATARITTRSLALRKAHVFRMVGSLEDQEQAETGDSEAHAPAIAEDAADGPAAAAEEETAAETEAEDYPAVKYLTRSEANAIDEELMDEDIGFPLESLMELAGKSVADAIYDAYPPGTPGDTSWDASERAKGIIKGTVLVLCGKGNNGGDGLVAARHLKMYGYNVQVVYPERQNVAPFRGLVNQLKAFDVPVVLSMPGAYGVDLVVDCVFGFNFKGTPRAPWDVVLKQLVNPEFFGEKPIVSVDVPLGWDVNRGPKDDGETPVLKPDMLVSLTAPKGCAIHHKGTHYLGGRFIPYRMNIKYQLGLFNAPYQDTSTIVKLPDQELPALASPCTLQNSNVEPHAEPSPAITEFGRGGLTLCFALGGDS